MRAPTVYHYRASDGVYMGCDAAFEDILAKGTYHKPACSTYDAPPEDIPEGQVAVWVAVQWKVMPDFRHVPLYDTETGDRYNYDAPHGPTRIYTGIGDLPAWLTTAPRPDAAHVFKDGAWVVDAFRDDARKRSARDQRLMQTDPFMLPDYPITDAQREDMRAYRDALRDWPHDDSFRTATALPAAPAWSGLDALTPFKFNMATVAPPHNAVEPTAQPVPPIPVPPPQESPL